MRLTLAIVLQIAALVSFLIWGFTAMFAPMLFAGTPNVRTWIVFLTFLIMPVLMIIASIAVWIGFAKRNNIFTVAGAVLTALSYIAVLASLGA